MAGNMRLGLADVVALARLRDSLRDTLGAHSTFADASAIEVRMSKRVFRGAHAALSTLLGEVDCRFSVDVALVLVEDDDADAMDDEDEADTREPALVVPNALGA